jgi:NAD(P)-dependent dehydrogenase (short-subunit alcohol dehydrogenase family)
MKKGLINETNNGTVLIFFPMFVSHNSSTQDGSKKHMRNCCETRHGRLHPSFFSFLVVACCLNHLDTILLWKESFMAHPISRSVLITGCSSGIGRATARHLATRGWTVYATSRRLDGLDDLAQVGCRLLSLDVTNEASMQEAVSTIEQAEGAVGVLINNAGYSQSGAIESVSIDSIRRQFETNVFGLMRLTQLVLPHMRLQRWGKIVNISSMGGRLTFPGGSYYHATKYAVEAFTDVLRYEVARFGIDAILIEPGIIRTNFGEAAATAMGSVPAANDPYSAFNEAVARSTREVYERGPMVRLGGPPEAVARTIERAITRSRPRTRYPVTLSAHILIALRRLFPDRAWDRFLRTQYPQPQ